MIDQLIEKHVSGLWSDNPGGRWLEGQREKFEKIKGTSQENKFIFRTAPTAGFKKPVMISVDVLMKVPGIEGEERRIRANDPHVTALADDMKTNGFDQKHPVFVNVAPDGRAWINNGNHRIRAAALADLDKIPANVQYFGGGEEIDTLWHPERLLRMR